jgi:hypothetical protein
VRKEGAQVCEEMSMARRKKKSISNEVVEQVEKSDPIPKRNTSRRKHKNSSLWHLSRRIRRNMLLSILDRILYLFLILLAVACLVPIPKFIHSDIFI